MIDFVATSLYHRAMWYEKSIYPRIERGFAFTSNMNGEHLEQFNAQTFTQGSAILKIFYINISDSFFQQIAVRNKS